jgi:hypothetical protein
MLHKKKVAIPCTLDLHFVKKIKRSSFVMLKRQGNRIKFSRVFLGSLYPMQLYTIFS